jgi:branched-chain amino acid transport system ATP-binding protein
LRRISLPVFFEDKDITGLPAYRVTNLGIARTFQAVKIIPKLTVEENVMVEAFYRIADRKVARKEAREILKLIDLTREANAYPTELTIAAQKRIELARVLATKPKLLMLDKVAVGPTPLEIKEIVETLRRIKGDRALTFFDRTRHGIYNDHLRKGDRNGWGGAKLLKGHLRKW